jgi:hypothetical protein
LNVRVSDNHVPSCSTSLKLPVRCVAAGRSESGRLRLQPLDEAREPLFHRDPRRIAQRLA